MLEKCAHPSVRNHKVCLPKISEEELATRLRGQKVMLASSTTYRTCCIHNRHLHENSQPTASTHCCASGHLETFSQRYRHHSANRLVDQFQLHHLYPYTRSNLHPRLLTSGA